MARRAIIEAATARTGLLITECFKSPGKVTTGLAPEEMDCLSL